MTLLYAVVHGTDRLEVYQDGSRFCLTFTGKRIGDWLLENGIQAPPVRGACWASSHELRRLERWIATW